MPSRDAWLLEASATTLARLLPRVEARFADQTDPVEWDMFLTRVRRHFPRLFGRLHQLYGGNYDFYYHLEELLVTITRLWMERSDELKALDALREADPTWYLSNRMVGAMCYVDLFANDLASLREKIPYLSELGVTYLHLMPLFKTPDGDDDGGYAISSYREVDPALGTMEELADLATDLRHHGISLTLDFIFNHTSDEHPWAKQALAGNKEYQSFYRMYPDRSMPDAFERGMPEVFTDDHPGSFTYSTRLKRWVWTTFHTYQWDLNYENPTLFMKMAEEMLFLANQGIEILRLDAVAFIWKELGTSCQNLPQAHWIIQAFNAIAAIAAPAMIFKSEAIVHPDEVSKYIDIDECPLSYNPQLMALLWEALATRDVRALSKAMNTRYALPDGCAWVNYIRCHDDIGWAFADEEIKASGFDPDIHRKFLTRFYTGTFEGSFARGLPFQEDPVTGVARVSGMTASLTGIEKAEEEGDEEAISLAVDRALLLHGVIITIGGVPMLYLGDEIAMTNDYTYDTDPEKVGDSRWLHRPPFNGERSESRRDPATVPGRVFGGLLRLVQLRIQNPVFARGETEFVETGNRHVFGFLRSNEQGMIFALFNFSEQEQRLEARRLRQMGMRKTMIDLYAGRPITATQELTLAPYQFMILSKAGG